MSRHYEGPAGTPEQLRLSARSYDVMVRQGLHYARVDASGKREKAREGRHAAASSRYYARMGERLLGETVMKTANAFDVFAANYKVLRGVVERRELAEEDREITRQVVQALKSGAAYNERHARQLSREAFDQFAVRKDLVRERRHKAAVLRYYADQEEKR